MQYPIEPRPNLQMVATFFYHIVCRFTLARWAILLTLLILLLEYAVMSVMIALAASGSIVSGNESLQRSYVVEGWSLIASYIGFKPDLMTWIWFFLILLTLRSAVGYAHTLISIYLSKQVHRKVSDDVFRRILFDEPISQIYRRSIGHYITLAGDDAFRAGALVNSSLQIIAGILSVLVAFILLFLFSPIIFAGTLSFLAVAALAVVICVRFMLNFNNSAIMVQRESSTTFLEALNSLRSIRSMSSEDFARKGYSEVTIRYTSLQMQVDGLKAGIKAIPGFIAVFAGVIALGPWFSDVVPFTPEIIFAGTMIILRLFASLGLLMTAAGTFLTDFRAITDLSELIELDDNASQMRVKPTDKPQIESSWVDSFDELVLRQINYKYAPDQPILENVNFTFRQGSIHAIVGPSGSGKSTLADLLLGIIHQDSGEIFIGGRLIKSNQLRNRVVLVEQQPRIFSVSVRENLTMGMDVSDKLINEVIEVVDLSEVICALPEGFNTIMNYQGSNLSGGQRQRLSIARALLRKPHVLILDEATSALDSQTRDVVVSRIRTWLKKGIIVFITHDETIAELADDVLELKPSYITE